MPEIGSAVQSSDASSDAAILREMQRKQQKQPISKNGKTPLVRKSGYDALDKNSFLKLLVTQLSKQDPTNPMNDREFISQMAQFSSLEQMNNVANSMNKLRGAQARIERFRPYAEKYQDVLTELASKVEGSSHPLLMEHP